MRRVEPIVVRRASAATDEYGDPVPDVWADHLELSGKFAPNNPSEPVEVGRNAVITGGTVYVRDLASKPDIVSTDRARVSGSEYEIDGEVGVWLRADTWAVQFAVKAIKEAR